MEGLFVPLGFFAVVFGILYVFFTTRNKERLAAIEKGIELETVKQPKSKDPKQILSSSLKAGMFFVGIAIGILLGSILERYTSLDDVASYFSMILLFGGLGLVLFYVIAKKDKKDN